MKGQVNGASEQRRVAAIFDLVTDGDRFLCGVIRWTLLIQARKGNQIPSYGTATLAESLYWDPAAMADDLLRRYAHTTVSWDAAHPLEVLAREAAGPVAGPFLYDPMDAEVVAVSRHLRAYRPSGPRQVDYPLARLEQARPVASPSSWWSELWSGLLTKALRSRWLSQDDERKIKAYIGRHRDYTQIRPAGVLGLTQGAESLRELLSDRCFDMARWLTETSASEQLPCELDWIREGLSGPNGAPSVFVLEDGTPASPEALASLWRAGNVWRVVEASRHRVDLLNQILHVGLHGYLTTNRLSGPAATLWANPRPHASWKYAIDTRSWWQDLLTLGAEAAA